MKPWILLALISVLLASIHAAVVPLYVQLVFPGSFNDLTRIEEARAFISTAIASCQAEAAPEPDGGEPQPFLTTQQDGEDGDGGDGDGDEDPEPEPEPEPQGDLLNIPSDSIFIATGTTSISLHKAILRVDFEEITNDYGTPAEFFALWTSNDQYCGFKLSSLTFPGTTTNVQLSMVESLEPACLVSDDSNNNNTPASNSVFSMLADEDPEPTPSQFVCGKHDSCQCVLGDACSAANNCLTKTCSGGVCAPEEGVQQNNLQQFNVTFTGSVLTGEGKTRLDLLLRNFRNHPQCKAGGASYALGDESGTLVSVYLYKYLSTCKGHALGEVVYNANQGNDGSPDGGDGGDGDDNDGGDGDDNDGGDGDDNDGGDGESPDPEDPEDPEPTPAPPAPYNTLSSSLDMFLTTLQSMNPLQATTAVSVRTITVGKLFPVDSTYDTTCVGDDGQLHCLTTSTVCIIACPVDTACQENTVCGDYSHCDSDTNTCQSNAAAGSFSRRDALRLLGSLGSFTLVVMAVVTGGL